MRPRLIQGVPGLDPNASPFERFQQFTQRMLKVSKVEADMEAVRSARPKVRKPKSKKA